MKNTKVNYTTAQVQVLQEMYTGADNRVEVASIAQEIGKSEASVRAKLSTLGFYVKATKAPRSNTHNVTKAHVAAEIADLTGMTEVETSNLTKTTSAVLGKLLTKLTNS